MTTEEDEAPEIVYCELCRLPHRAGVLHCEECKHQLGTPVDWKALECQLPDLRIKVALGIATLLAMLAFNLFLFGGAGYIIWCAPLYWTVMTTYRYRSLARHLAAARIHDRPT
jgi:hypothetical protein